MALQVFGTPATRRNKAKEFQDIVSAGIGGASKVIQGNIASRQQKEDDEAIKEAYGIDLSHFKDPKERLAALTSELATKGKEKLLAQKQENTRSALGRLGLGEEPLSQGQPQQRPSLVGEPQEMPEIGGELGGLIEQTGAAQQPPQQKRQRRPADIPDEEILALRELDEGLANQVRQMKDTDIRKMQEEKKEESRILEKKEDRAHKEKLLNRQEETALAKPILEENSKILKNIPLQRNSIQTIRTASPGVGWMDYIADKFKFEPLLSAEGAQLKSAIKDFFMSDLVRAGGKINVFLEQQLMGALAQVGRSEESNLISAEGMEFKVDLAEKRVELMNMLAEQDVKSQGWVNGRTLESRAYAMMKPYVEERQQQLENRVKDIISRKENKLPPVEKGRVRMFSPTGEAYDLLPEDVEEAEANEYTYSPRA